MSMNFNFNEYGKLSIGNKTIQFKDADTNGDGKIDKAEYNELKSLIQENGEDIVSFGSVNRNKDEAIDENEFKILEQKSQIQDSINNFKAIIAVDFAGSSQETMTALNKELKDFAEEFIDEYEGDVSQMANKFKDALPTKYAEIRTALQEKNLSTVQNVILTENNADSIKVNPQYVDYSGIKGYFEGDNISKKSWFSNSSHEKVYEEGMSLLNSDYLKNQLKSQISSKLE